jgi:hypothetical protein
MSEDKVRRRSPNFQDLTGQKFGRLTAIEYVEGPEGKSAWRCRCDCGNEKLVAATLLKRALKGKSYGTKSCGCLYAERRPWSGAADVALAAYQDGSSLSEIGRSLDITHHTVRALIAGKVPLRTFSQANQKYHCDEDAFLAESPERNYWLGFLLADGSVEIQGQSGLVSVLLAEKDAGHLLSLRRFLRSNHPITFRLNDRGYANGGGGARIRFGSIRLARSLDDAGVSPRKTFSACVPSGLSDDVDFWRGMVDGDGWLGMTRYKSKGGPQWSVQLGLCGTRPICDGFAEFALRRLGPLRTRAGADLVRPNRSIWKVNLKSRRALRMADLLYSDSCISLPRKKAIADAFAAFASNL